MKCECKHSLNADFPCPVLRQRVEISPLFRYHSRFVIQGLPVFFSGRPQGWQALRKLGLAFFVAAVPLTGSVLVATPSQASDAPSSVALSQLPSQAQATHRLIRSGGPFPYAKDGTVFGNRERLLPRHARGYYREYTVQTPGSRNRGARRIICGGREPVNPEACFYTADHYASFRLIAQ